MAALGARAPLRSAAPGQIVYSPAQPVSVLFIVKRGRIRLYRIGQDGRSVTNAVFEPGAIFGDMEPLGLRMRTNWAEALESSELCLMSRTDVRELLFTDPRIALRIAESLATRIDELEQRLTDLSCKTLDERLASMLCSLAHRQPDAPIKLTHHQLASLIGASRERTTTALQQLGHRDLQACGPDHRRPRSAARAVLWSAAADRRGCARGARVGAGQPVGDRRHCRAARRRRVVAGTPPYRQRGGLRGPRVLRAGITHPGPVPLDHRIADPPSGAVAHGPFLDQRSRRRHSRSSTDAAYRRGSRPSVLFFFSVECCGCGPSAQALAEAQQVVGTRSTSSRSTSPATRPTPTPGGSAPTRSQLSTAVVLNGGLAVAAWAGTG